MEQTTKTEQEAAVSILFACAMNKDKGLTESKIDHLSRMMVMCSLFRGHPLNELSARALQYCTADGSKAVIESCAPFISSNFRETFFAMICEIMADEGQLDEQESELLGMVAMYLGISMEMMRMMLTTYLIRNRWSVQVID